MWMSQWLSVLTNTIVGNWLLLWDRFDIQQKVKFYDILDSSKDQAPKSLQFP